MGHHTGAGAGRRRGPLGRVGRLGGGCVFCGIAAGAVPARIVSETAMSVALLDAFPVARGHVLAVPRAHRERIQDLSGEESADLFALVCRLAARTDAVGGGNATLISVHNGRQSGQEVPHVHVHLIPRRDGDGAGPVHSMFGAERAGLGPDDDIHGALSDGGGAGGGRQRPPR